MKVKPKGAGSRFRRCCLSLLAALLLGGCAVGTYRAEKIRMEHPGWDEAIIRKVAQRQVEPGMTAPMVVAALGKPDRITRHGTEEHWGYAILGGSFEPRMEIVYVVILRDGLVVRTQGDAAALKRLSWYR